MKAIQKSWILIFALFMFVCILVGCSSDTNSKMVEEKIDGAQEPVIMKFATESTDADTLSQAFRYWAELVEEKTDEVEFEFHYNGSVGTNTELMDAMLMGEDYIIVADPSYFKDWVPEWDISCGPYFLEEESDYLLLTQTEWWFDQVQQLEDAGFILMGGDFLYSYRQILADREIRNPDDLSGVKMRVPTTDLSIAMAECMGAVATPLPFSEMFTALSSKTINAVENPISTLYNAKLHDAAKYLNLTNHQEMLITYICGAQTWEKLSEECQNIILECGKEAADYYNNTLLKSAEEECLEAMIEEGLIIVDDVDIDAFKASCETIYDGKTIPEWPAGLRDEIVAQVEALK